MTPTCASDVSDTALSIQRKVFVLSSLYLYSFSLVLSFPFLPFLSSFLPFFLYVIMSNLCLHFVLSFFLSFFIYFFFSVAQAYQQTV